MSRVASCQRSLAPGLKRVVDHEVDRALDESPKVGAAEERRCLCDARRINIVGGAISQIQRKDSLAYRWIRRGYEHNAVEATRPLHRLVDVPRRVRRGETEDVLVVGADRIELLQELVDERAPDASRVLPTGEGNRIQFVDEQNTRRKPPGLHARPRRSGLLTGVLTGFFGVGGGFVIVPALVLLLGLPITLAVGTSLAIIALTSASALTAHLASGRIDWGIAIAFAAAAIAGALLERRLGGRLDQRRLSTLFTLLLVGIAVLLVGIAVLLVIETRARSSNPRAQRLY